MKNLLIFICFLFCQTLCFINSVEILKMFIRNKKYDGHKCEPDDVIFNGTSRNEVGCAWQCTRCPNCLGILHYPATGKCQGCYARYDMSLSDDTTEVSHFYQFALYHGCFTDKDTRILDGPLFNDILLLTTEICVRNCRAGNFTYAMTEWSKHCLCGNSKRDYAELDDIDCNFQCSGDTRQRCGGYWKGSLYSIK